MYDLDLAAKLATAAMAAGGGVDAGLVLAVTHFTTGAHEAADGCSPNSPTSATPTANEPRSPTPAPTTAGCSWPIPKARSR